MQLWEGRARAKGKLRGTGRPKRAHEAGHVVWFSLILIFLGGFPNGAHLFAHLEADFLEGLLVDRVLVGFLELGVCLLDPIIINYPLG